MFFLYEKPSRNKSKNLQALEPNESIEDVENLFNI
jgi:hypothetical protein